MRMYDLIEKKKRGESLLEEEILYMVDEFCSGSIPDYQMSAMLMAIYFQGMDNREVVCLTEAMAKSGDIVDLSSIQGIKIDKHSTGGVGDKTTLIVGPIVASLGVKVAKMSGRGLGHTGGTVDKLESIPGFKTSLEKEEFFRIVNECGIAVIGQSGNLAPADKKLYALRDVTSTVDSIPLIASSIMSKKLAIESNGIVLDVKTGSGAFMKSLEDAILLAEKMVSIGTLAGRSCCALITNMDTPLGFNIGNSLEIQEVVETLRGNGPKDLETVCLELAADMLVLAGYGTADVCRKMAEKAIMDGSALASLVKMVESQGGDVAYILEPERFEPAAFVWEWKAVQSGYISHMDAEGIGKTSVILGAGRNKKEDIIDYSAGIILKKKYGDYVEMGDVVAELHTSEESRIGEAIKCLEASYVLSNKKPEETKMLCAKVNRDGVWRY